MCCGDNDAVARWLRRYKLADYLYATVGVGYCRGPDGVSQRVNGRVRRESTLTGSDCAAACTVLSACVGYAWATHGACWLYGEGVDIGLPTLQGILYTEFWQGNSQENSAIGDTASGYVGVVCKVKGDARLNSKICLSPPSLPPYPCRHPHLAEFVPALAK